MWKCPVGTTSHWQYIDTLPTMKFGGLKIDNLHATGRFEPMHWESPWPDTEVIVKFSDIWKIRHQINISSLYPLLLFICEILLFIRVSWAWSPLFAGFVWNFPDLKCVVKILRYTTTKKGRKIWHACTLVNNPWSGKGKFGNENAQGGGYIRMTELQTRTEYRSQVQYR